MLRHFTVVAVAVAALGSMAGAATRAPAVPELSASYDIKVAMLTIGQASLTAAVEADAYRAGAVVSTKGLARLFAEEDWAAEATGQVDPRGLTPVRFRSSDDKRDVVVDFDAGVPERVQVEPEPEVKPWSIDPRAQQGVTDPVTALVSLLAPVPAGEACGRRVEAFDGRHRFAFVLGEADTADGTIRCEGAFAYLAGYKPDKAGRTRAFSVEYAERDGGLVQIERITLPTTVGNVVMRLRD